MKNNNIVLVGFMGTGKSSVGRAVASKSEYAFVDMDEIIEQREGKSINAVFSEYGEDFFRQLEHRLVLELSEISQKVIAAGGGVVKNQDNIELFKKKGCIICLTATPQEISRRLQNTSSRPLLNKKNKIQVISDLMRQRAIYYSQFELQVDTTGKTIDRIADEVLRLNSKS
jgi:shikimate kinase